jgi:hypothetical protein
MKTWSDTDTINAVPNLPLDPDGMNEARTEWADIALATFMARTHADQEDAVADLITSLAHWCDRNGQDFDAELARGRANYISDTTLD